MVPGLINSFKVWHELFIMPVIDGGRAGENFFQGGIVEDQQFSGGIITGTEQAHIGIYRITGWRLSYFCKPIEMKGNSLFSFIALSNQVKDFSLLPLTSVQTNVARPSRAFQKKS